MPSISPELEVGILKNMQKALEHVTIRPKDAELDILTAFFFLKIHDFPPLQK